MSTFLNACFMPSLTLTPRMGAVVCPPIMRLMFPTFAPKPPIKGKSLGICTRPLTMPLAPTPRNTVSFLPFTPPKAPSSTEESSTMALIVLFGRFSFSASEPEK